MCWPFKSTSGNTLTVVSKTVSIRKDTTIKQVYFDKDGKKIDTRGGYNSYAYPDAKISYEEETNFHVYTEDTYDNGIKANINFVASSIGEDEANKVFDFLVKQKGRQTQSTIVKTETIKQ